jgi:hypothetical protein
MDDRHFFYIFLWMIATLATNKSSFLKKALIGIDMILPNFSYKKSQQGGRWRKGKNKDISLESIADSKSQLPKADDGNHNSTTNDE